MEMSRVALSEGVWLNHLHNKGAGSACLSIHLLTQLARESAAMNALLPAVLRRGCARYGDDAALAVRLDELGAEITPSVRLFGEIQALGFCAALPDRRELLRPVCALLGELLLHPATRGGLLLPQYVDDERDKLAAALRRRDPVTRCVEEMCGCEDYAVGRCGSAADVNGVRYQKLSKHYRALLPVCPVEIVYCGSADKKQLAALLREVLATLPRGELDTELGTELRMNALEAEPRTVEERLDVSQGKLVVGWRLGACMEEPDQAALCVFRALFAGSLPPEAAPELFMDMHKGVLLAALSTENAAAEEVQDTVFSRLAALRAGDFSETALQRARRDAAEPLRRLAECPASLESFWLSQIVLGLDYGPAELAELCAEPTREELRAIAQSLDCDLIYLSAPDDSAEFTEREDE